LPTQNIYDTIVNGRDRKDFAQKNQAIMAVLNTADQNLFLDELMVERFAERVQGKRINYVLSLLEKTSFAHSWFAKGSEFMQLMDWVNESNLNHFHDLEGYLMANDKGLSKKDSKIMAEALRVCSVKVSDPNVSADSPIYWKEKFHGVELGELVSSGLLLEKIAGHEVIEEMTIPVEVVR
jgi:hypothetical protein